MAPVPDGIVNGREPIVFAGSDGAEKGSVPSPLGRLTSKGH